MTEREKAFRERIARITRIQNLQEAKEQYAKENITEHTKEDDGLEILPAICKVKKSIENFRTKPIEETQEAR